MLRNFFLIAQPPLLAEEGKIRDSTIEQQPLPQRPLESFRVIVKPSNSQVISRHDSGIVGTMPAVS
jgi:hypothetical protein